MTLGNGSNDVLVLLAEAFLTAGVEAVYSQFAFAVYPIAVQASGASRADRARRGRRDDAQPLGHDPAAHPRRDRTEDAACCSSRIPTTRPAPGWTRRHSTALLRAVPPEVIVVLDEAYHEYSATHGVPDGTRWLARHPNLVVTRTFSKAYGLAGLRVGYALSHPDLADILNRVRQPFNVSVPALAAAAAALDDREHLEMTLALNRAGIDRLRTGLATPRHPGAGIGRQFRTRGPRRDRRRRINECLLRGGVIVRPVGNYGLPNHLRISTGTPAQNERLLAAMAAAIAAAP